MKKLVGWLLAILIVLSVAGVVLYKYYLPEMIADAVVNDGMPSYVPKAIQQRVNKYKEPLSKAATDVVKEMHAADVSMDQVFQAIDKTDQQDVQMALSELKEANLKTPDEAFDIVKKHIDADFDVEVLREPFNKHVDMNMIRIALKRSNQYNNEPMDAEMAKAVIKNILLQKEKEFLQKTGVN